MCSVEVPLTGVSDMVRGPVDVLEMGEIGMCGVEVDKSTLDEDSIFAAVVGLRDKAGRTRYSWVDCFVNGEDDACFRLMAGSDVLSGPGTGATGSVPLGA